MRISRARLREIIKEEVTVALDEEEGGTLEDLASMFGELAPELDDIVAVLQDMPEDQKQLAVKQLLSQLGDEGDVEGLDDPLMQGIEMQNEYGFGGKTGGLATVAGRQLGKRDDENNPWAICTASVGREDKEKYEKCVKSVKKQNRK